jgi:outer membrane protein assembly factor BamD
MGLVVLALAGCSSFNLFGPPKIKEEVIVPPAVLYQSAIKDMDAQRYNTAIATLEKLERQSPTSDYAERAKLMQVYGNYRIGKFDEAVLAADRFLAIFPGSKETAYVLWLKGTSYFAQIKDITRDQQLSRDAIETYQLLISNYPKSEHAKDARDKMVIAVDQLAGKEMSVGRYYLGNGQYTAAINRFRVVVETFQTSSHIEEALYRLTEGYLALGLVNEAQTAAAVLGHNYPSSTWYSSAYNLLNKQGLEPKVVDGNWIATQNAGKKAA